MEERKFYRETKTVKKARLQCPFCRSTETYDLRWLIRTKKDKMPPGGDEEDRRKFERAQSYMVLMDHKVVCKNVACQKPFDITGIKTMAFLVEDQTPARRR